MPFTHIENATLEENVNVGPFSRIRPGSLLCKGSKIGNFVEVKKSKVGKNSKINHLSYVGDSSIGKNVNIGAGTITCNYDGKKKNKTKILDDAFIGSNTSLVAPIKIGKKAVVGAGSTLSKNVNIGAGTITCNYDGKKKNKTKILDGAFIGSNTALVAPIKIGKKAIVGAGSTLSRDVKDKSLALTRAKQLEIKNYKRK